MRRIAASLCLSLVAATVSPADAGFANGEHPEGCQSMLLLGIVDGDTVYGYIDTSDPLVAIRAKLRLSGIDTPERRGHARCEEERVKAEEVKAYVERILQPALERPTRKAVRACEVREDKYATRRSGRLEVHADHGWLDLGELLLKKGLAFPYDGGKRGDRWCRCLRQGDCPEGYRGAS
jgi:endonuclease YncB( thermonuclease family)